MHSLRTAIGFLTRVPMGAIEDRRGLLKRAVPWFPVVGAAIGLAQGLVFAGLASVVSPLVAAAVAVGAALLITGAFHHDGLADMADAFGGGWDVEQRMTILKDSRLGTYGTAAVAMALLIEVTTLASFDQWDGMVALVVVHAISRAAAVTVMATTRAAGDGLGASYMEDIGWRQAVVAVTLAAAATGLAFSVASQWWQALLMVAVVAAVSAVVAGLSYRKICGITGDVLGAVQVVAMLAGLVVLAAS